MIRIIKLIISKLKKDNRKHLNTIYTYRGFDIEEFMRTVTGRKEGVIEFVKNHFSNGFTIHYPLEESAGKY